MIIVTHYFLDFLKDKMGSIHNMVCLMWNNRINKFFLQCLLNFNFTKFNYTFSEAKFQENLII